MAGKSSLLFLTLVTQSVSISAHRLLVVEKHEAVAPSSLNIKEENNDVTDFVNLGKVDTVGGGIYPSSVPVGRDSGFQFQLGPIGFGASWHLGFPFPIFGPPLVPQNVWPYYQSGPHLNPYELQVQSQGQGSGQASSPESHVGYAPGPSPKGVNTPEHT